MKICKDINCKRPGQMLRLSEFPICRRNDDGHYIYCLECCRRRSRELRAAKGAREYRKRESGIDRKPMVLSSMAFTKVYDAVNNGCRTREEIRRETKLDWDSIGEALSLLLEEKGLRIQRLPGDKRIWLPFDSKAA